MYYILPLRLALNTVKEQKYYFTSIARVFTAIRELTMFYLKLKKNWNVFKNPC